MNNAHLKNSITPAIILKNSFSRSLAVALFLIMSGSLATHAQAELRYAGSDTVEPLIDAARVAHARRHPGYSVQIQSTGTSAGLRELCSGRAALVGASRPIKSGEMTDCASANIQYTEIPVALDAVVLVVSTKNDWLKALTLAEVTTLYAPTSADKLMSWKQLRTGFPDVPLRTSGVGIKHGTFGFFLQSIGLNNYLRSDFKDFSHHSETGRYVATAPGHIGFMSLAEALAMEGKVRVLGIDFGTGVVMPSPDTVLANQYGALSRIVYLYINQPMVIKAGGQDIAFATTLISDTEKLVKAAGLIALQPLQYQENTRRVSFNK